MPSLTALPDGSVDRGTATAAGVAAASAAAFGATAFYSKGLVRTSVEHMQPTLIPSFAIAAVLAAGPAVAATRPPMEAPVDEALRFFKQWREWRSACAGGSGIERVGRKASGSSLDGVDWKQRPNVFFGIVVGARDAPSWTLLSLRTATASPGALTTSRPIVSARQPIPPSA